MKQEWVVTGNSATIRGAEAVERVLLDYIERTFAVAAASLRELSPWLVAEEHRVPGTSRRIREFAKASPELAEALRAPAFSGIASDLLQAPVRLHDVRRLRTVMRDFDFTLSRPHQDHALWPDEPEHVAMWLALCDVDDDLAPLHVLPGSSASVFRHEINEYQQSEIPRAALAGLPETAITMRYGDTLSFNPLLVHFAGRNNTPDVRWSIDFRFSRTD